MTEQDKSRLRERLAEIVCKAPGTIADALIAAGVTLPPEPESVSEREKFARQFANLSAHECADLLLAERDRAVREVHVLWKVTEDRAFNAGVDAMAAELHCMQAASGWSRVGDAAARVRR